MTTPKKPGILPGMRKRGKPPGDQDYFRFHTAPDRGGNGSGKAFNSNAFPCKERRGNALQSVARNGMARQRNARQGFNLRAWRSGSASALGADGRGFKSRRPDHLFPPLPLPVETRRRPPIAGAERNGTACISAITPCNPGGTTSTGPALSGPYRIG